MEYYVGLDVSLKQTSICVVDQTGSVVREGVVDSDPEAISVYVRSKAPGAVRIGLETGPTSTWLWTELKRLGLPVICIDARHAKAVLKMQINKSDRNDAIGIARIMQTGWFKEVHVKDIDSHSVRALLASRALLVKIKRDLENHVRGLLKNLGLVIGRAKFNVFTVRAEELIEGRRRSLFERTGAAKSPSARCKPASTSNTAGLRSSSPGKASTKWTKSPAADQPNCSTTARSRSNSHITTAMKPCSKPSGILLQQPARAEHGKPKYRATEAFYLLQKSHSAAIPPWRCQWNSCWHSSRIFRTTFVRRDLRAMEQQLPTRVGRRLSAIVAADVAGYSRLMGLDEVGTARILREHRAVADALVAKHGGRIVKTTGDGVLLEFPSVVDAVECAVAVQAVMAERNDGVPEDRRMLFGSGSTSATS